jgi:hypothetical protein
MDPSWGVVREQDVDGRERGEEAFGFALFVEEVTAGLVLPGAVESAEPNAFMLD